MEYTLQKELDDLGLGKMWGCAFVALALNIGEHARGRKATEEELTLIIGWAFRTKLAYMCNYVDDKDLQKEAKDIKDWSRENPEWHYYIGAGKRIKLFRLACKVLGVWPDPSLYQVAIMWTQYETRHYCSLTISGELINPDPSLKGHIIETKELIY